MKILILLCFLFLAISTMATITQTVDYVRFGPLNDTLYIIKVDSRGGNLRLHKDVCNYTLINKNMRFFEGIYYGGIMSGERGSCFWITNANALLPVDFKYEFHTYNGVEIAIIYAITLSILLTFVVTCCIVSFVSIAINLLIIRYFRRNEQPLLEKSNNSI